METLSKSILILDTNNDEAGELQQILERDAYDNVLVANSCEEALQVTKKFTIHAILLHVYKEGERDCIDTIKQIYSHRFIPVIFVTATPHKKLLSLARKTNAAAVIVKPYLPDQITIALKAAFNLQPLNGHVPGVPEKNPKHKDFLYIKEKYKFVRIPVKDILYIQSDNNMTYVFINDRKFVLRRSMQELLEKIEHTKLVRVHRSYVVNVVHVSAFDDTHVFIGKESIPMSKKFKVEFMSRLILL